MLFLPFKKGERDIVLKISKMVEFYVFFLKLYKKRQKKKIRQASEGRTQTPRA